MENCLQKKLKGVVSNNNLLRLGAVRIYHLEQQSFSNSVKLQVYQNKTSTCQAVDTYFVNSSGINIGNVCEIGSGARLDVYCAIPYGRFDIMDKKSLKELIAANLYYYVDTKSFVGCQSLKVIRMQMSGDLSGLSELTSLTELQIIAAAPDGLTGDIVALSELTSLTDLRIGNYNYIREITGDIKSLGKLIGLSRIDIIGTSIFGKLESFIENLFANGKTSNTLHIYGGNTSPYVTFNDASLESNDVLITFNGTGAVVTIGGNTIGTLSNGTWTYA